MDKIGPNFLRKDIARVVRRPRKQLFTTKACLCFETPPWYYACWQRPEVFMLRISSWADFSKGGGGGFADFISN